MPKGSFDADGFYSALNRTREARNLNWKQVAEEAGISASTLTRMAQGKRPDIDGLAALTNWSGLKADNFVRSDSTPGDAETVAMISTYLRADKNLSATAAQKLESIIQTSYEQLKDL